MVMNNYYCCSVPMFMYFERVSVSAVMVTTASRQASEGDMAGRKRGKNPRQKVFTGSSVESTGYSF